MSRHSSVHQTFVLSCLDVCPFNRLSCFQPIFVVESRKPFISTNFHFQTFERLPDFRAFIMSFVRSSAFVRSPDFCVVTKIPFHVQTFIRSPDSCAVNHFSCFQVQTFINFRAFNRHSFVHVQTFVCSTDFCAFMSRLLCVL